MAAASPSASERDPSGIAPGAPARAAAGEERGGGEVNVRLRAALLSLLVSAALLAVKYFAYLATGSVAILSDALESIINVVAAVFAVAVLRFASRPADRNHPYGHGKMEYFSAVFEGGLIAFAALAVIAYAIRDLVRGPDVHDLEYGLALTVAAGAINAALGWYLVRTGRRERSIALVADGKHVLSDFQTSVGVVVGLGLVALTGKAWFDPLAALLVGTNLCVTGYRLVREAAGGLLDEEDPRLLAALVEAFEQARFPGMIRIHRLRAIRSGRETYADAHVIVPEYWSVEQAHDQVNELERRVLAIPTIDGEIIFHVDPCLRAFCAVCDVPDCPVREEPFAGRTPLTLAEATSPGPTGTAAPSPADARS
ncbi:MAG TPA: cation diffusion facilitator family transporter [Candidatus Binatia bacterium]